MDLPPDIWERLGLDPDDLRLDDETTEMLVVKAGGPLGKSTLQRRARRRFIYWRDGFRCRDCGATFSAPKGWRGENIPGLTLGHIVPRSWGGTWSRGNLIAQCTPCNDDLEDEVWPGYMRYPNGRPKE